MTEAGGPTTHAGITYQNSIAALYLGRMLDTALRPIRDRVIKVRTEVPADVDDIQIWMADGSIKMIQAKTKLKSSGTAWRKIWLDFKRALDANSASQTLILSLTVGENTNLSSNLRECTERAESSVSYDEYSRRLTKPQIKLVENIANVLSVDHSSAMSLLSKIMIEIIPKEFIERDYAPQWMPRSAPLSFSIFQLLRDHCASRSAQRALFLPEPLREFLKNEHKIDILYPLDWGADAYRSIVVEQANVVIPGTSFSKKIDDSFPWPICCPFDNNREADFDDEATSYSEEVYIKSVDMRRFPSRNFNRVVLVGGAGLGKSVVSSAIAGRLAKNGKLPVTIKIPTFCKNDYTIDEFLSKVINPEFSINIDWQHAAEKGRVVLILDGLDEVAPAHRQLVLERLKVYSARYPLVPWLLTVRDATAINIAIAGELIEIKPLDNIAVQKMIEFYRSEDKKNIVEAFSKLLSNRPDLSRLVRIPLFLALLCVTSKDLKRPPSNRSELLEDYLSILLKPEFHKPSDVRGLDAIAIRSISEKVAFDALLREQIGVDEKLLLMSMDALGLDNSVDVVANTLTTCGMLKRSGPTKLYFPFPIIQEYLAGCYLAEEAAESIPNRLGEVIKKPWAQAIQFALEKHPAPESISREILDGDVDAFSTHLRLLSRCVANGMPCTPEIRTEITDGLVEFWRKAGWELKERVGQLLSEAFYNPLTPRLREALFERRFLHCGLGQIVTNIDDDKLTIEVLGALLNSGEKHLYNLAELQIAVDKVAERAFDLYINLAQNPDESDLESDDLEDMLSCLLSHLNTDNISQCKITNAAQNENLFLGLRLVCFLKIKKPIDDDLKSLIRIALARDGFYPRNAAFALLAEHTALSEIVLEFFSKPKTIEEDLYKFLDAIPKRDGPEFHLSLASNAKIPENVRLRSLVFAARYGSRSAMEELLSNIDINPAEIVTAALSLFGHHQSYELAKMAADELSNREWSRANKLSIASSLRTGMTTIFEMDSFQGGLLEYSPLHLGAPLFESLLEEWSDCPEFNTRDKTSYDLSLAHIGYEAAALRINERLIALLSANDVDLKNWETANLIGSAVRFLQRFGQYPTIETIESIIQKSSHNGIFPCFDLLAAIGTREALDILLWSYNGGTDEARGAAFTAIEKLAGRLGVLILDSDGKLGIK